MSVFDFDAFDRFRERTNARIRRRSRLGWHVGTFILLNALYWTYFLYLQGFYSNHDLFGLILTPAWGLVVFIHLMLVLRAEGRIDAEALREAEMQARATVGFKTKEYAYLNSPEEQDEFQVLEYASEKRKNRG